MTIYPEHEKLSEAVTEGSQVIGDFLEWLGSSKGITLCLIPDDQHSTYYPISTSSTNLLAEFFDIDLEEVEAEKRDMLKLLREAASDQ